MSRVKLSRVPEAARGAGWQFCWGSNRWTGGGGGGGLGSRLRLIPPNSTDYITHRALYM